MRLTFVIDPSLIYQTNKTVVLKLFSLYESINNGNYVNLDVLTPPVYTDQAKTLLLDYRNEIAFDMFYANFLVQYDEQFLCFFNIIQLLYSGYDVYIITDFDQYGYRETVTSSLIKFIQQRYGINVNYVYTVDDYNEQFNETSFSMQGLFMFDQDNERFLTLSGIDKITMNGD